MDLNEEWWKFNQHHCEKTSFVVAFLFGLFALSIYMIFTSNQFFLANDLLFIFSGALIIGLLGIIWYTYAAEKSMIPPIILLIITIGILLFVPMYTITELTCNGVICTNPGGFISLFGDLIN